MSIPFSYNIWFLSYQRANLLLWLLFLIYDVYLPIFSFVFVMNHVLQWAGYSSGWIVFRLSLLSTLEFGIILNCGPARRILLFSGGVISTLLWNSCLGHIFYPDFLFLDLWKMELALLCAPWLPRMRDCPSVSFLTLTSSSSLICICHLPYPIPSLTNFITIII